MGYGWGRGRRGGFMGPWPGRGPFSFLPPWQRPGWLFGRGACWWLFGNPFMYSMYGNPYYSLGYQYFTPWFNYAMPFRFPFYAPYNYPFFNYWQYPFSYYRW